MKTEADRRDRGIRTIPAIGFALTMLFVSVQSANAQWNPSPSPSPNTNIYYNAGNVGIGTASPATLLHLNATGAATARLGSGDNTNDYGRLEFYGKASSNGVSIGYLPFFNTRSSSASLDAAIEVDKEGSGADEKTTFTFLTHDGTSLGERLRIDSQGKVGIGATSPSALLHLNATGAATARLGSGVNTNDYGRLEFYGKSATNGVSVGYIPFVNTLNSGGVTVAAIDVPKEGTGSDNKAFFAFSTHNGSSLGERVRIDSQGNVGIGTSSPGTMLDVNGTISGTNVIAKYQDVAEWVPASKHLAAGTVVVLDATKSNQVTSSTVSYDTRVAGVVSAQPGIALGEKGENKVLVATTGRVRVKVDASKGAIHIGDLLVTSDIPGVAMKSEPVNLGGVQLHRPGTLIGKALEPLEKGKGEILVLLSLQ